MMIFNCPSCRAPIAELGGPGSVELVCDQCRFKYRVVSGTLLASASKPITVRSQFVQRSIEEVELYELQLDIGDRVRFTAGFEIDGRGQVLALVPNDLISLTYAMRKDERGALLTVINHTSGVTYEIARPDDRARNLARWLAGAVGGVAFVSLVSVEPTIALLVGSATGVGSFFGLRRLFAPTAQLAPGQQTQLSHVRSLLERKQELESHLVRVERERKNKLNLKARIEQLRAKMNSVDPALYEVRITQLGSAIATLDQQIALDDQLIDGYQRSAAMLEIEIEASAHANDLPDDIAEVLRAKEEQIAAIQAQNQELELKLSANQEVERLLKGRTTD